jgi:hypothetical protein
MIERSQIRGLSTYNLYYIQSKRLEMIDIINTVVSRATIIVISSRLRESSDGFDNANVLDDPEITNSTLNLS